MDAFKIMSISKSLHPHLTAQVNKNKSTQDPRWPHDCIQLINHGWLPLDLGRVLSYLEQAKFRQHHLHWNAKVHDNYYPPGVPMLK